MVETPEISDIDLDVLLPLGRLFNKTFLLL